jgi:hypothetical protein
MSQDEALLRQATPEDSEFAYRTVERAFRVYVETVFGWDEAFQRKLHEERFSRERYRIIRHSGEDVGILSTSRIDEFMKVNQIFILPEHQSKGLGGAVLWELSCRKRRTMPSQFVLGSSRSTSARSSFTESSASKRLPRTRTISRWRSPQNLKQRIVECPSH